MKRDMQLILRVLMWTEEHGNTHPIALPDFEGVSAAETSYHVRLCSEAGFLHITDSKEYPGRRVRILGLTWQGHEHLDANRN